MSSESAPKTEHTPEPLSYREIEALKAHHLNAEASVERLSDLVAERDRRIKELEADVDRLRRRTHAIHGTERDDEGHCIPCDFSLPAGSPGRCTHSPDETCKACDYEAPPSSPATPEGKRCREVILCKCKPDGLAHAGVCDEPLPCSMLGHGSRVPCLVRCLVPVPGEDPRRATICGNPEPCPVPGHGEKE